MLDPTIVLSPSHFTRVGGEIRTRDVMMNADLRTAQAREKRFRAAMKAALEKGGIAFVDDDKQLGIAVPR